jgi:Protein of unknown function (DUF2909)
MKLLILIAFILIIASLGSALFYMIRDRGQSDKTFRFLAMRVGFSVSLFILLLIAYNLNWIQPTGVPVR